VHQDKNALDRHIKRWNKCVECKYGKSTLNRFVYQGPSNPKYLFVLEHPTENQDLIGDTTLAPWQDQYTGVTYALPCTPYATSKRDRLATCSLLPEIKVCSPRLTELYGILHYPKVFAFGIAGKACKHQDVPFIQMPSSASIVSNIVDRQRMVLILKKEMV